ncbi:MAG: UDP-glucose 4-epimerase GalE [Firmicutes bacterium]|nr:UDP-glucose 4-epimerase GalE [Bacillota bacterium]
MKTIFITGGAGYIGSHTAVELLESGYKIIVADNFYNSNINSIENIKKITGKDFNFYEIDICNKAELQKVFKDNEIDAVIHFAGYKAVGESVANPLMYYRNNIDSTLSLLEVMQEFDCKKLVFSSSATVYGEPEKLPLDENCRLMTTNPYGSTKLYIEGILKDLYTSNNEWGISILRYFNPVGAHKSGLIGESPNGIPNNLMPYIVKVANKEISHLNIFGNDYSTKDGTGVRDYIHVIDLAKGHVKSLDKLFRDESCLDVFNLGTGNGYSVLELVNTFIKVNNVEIPYQIVERRPGDIAECYADPSNAKENLKWKAELSLEDMCKDAWHYIKKN